MSKKRSGSATPKSSEQPTRLVPRDQIPRLQGDALYDWAQLVAEEHHITQTKQALAIKELQERGLTPGEYVISNDGYILSQSELQARSRVQTVPAGPPVVPPTAPPAPESNADSESLEEGLRTGDLVG